MLAPQPEDKTSVADDMGARQSQGIAVEVARDRSAIIENKGLNHKTINVMTMTCFQNRTRSRCEPILIALRSEKGLYCRPQNFDSLQQGKIPLNTPHVCDESPPGTAAAT